MERTASSPNLDPRMRVRRSAHEWDVAPCTPAVDPVGSVVDDLLSGDVRDLRVEVAQLRGALVNRASIDQAKGMLMARYGVDADSAFRILQRWSSVSNIQLRELAEALVEIGVKGLAAPGLPVRGVDVGVLEDQLRSFARRRGPLGRDG